MRELYDLAGAAVGMYENYRFHSALHMDFAAYCLLTALYGDDYEAKVKAGEAGERVAKYYEGFGTNTVEREIEGYYVTEILENMVAEKYGFFDTDPSNITMEFTRTMMEKFLGKIGKLECTIEMCFAILNNEKINELAKETIDAQLECIDMLKEKVEIFEEYGEELEYIDDVEEEIRKMKREIAKIAKRCRKLIAPVAMMEYRDGRVPCGFYDDDIMEEVLFEDI